LDKLSNDEMNCFKFKNKSLSSNNLFYSAKWEKGFESVTENQLMTFSDQIYYSNLYHYYIFKGWVVRYDLNNQKTIFLTQ
jgi:hypothetical protein